MKKRSRCNSDTVKQELDSSGSPAELDNDNDISLLQRPLRTAHTGFEEARRAYDDGTNEVRRLLSQECSLIYECKVCRNMFRSLANFISHKRVFCCLSARAMNRNGYTDQNSTMIIQANNGPSPQDIEHMLRSRSTGCSPVPREAHSIRGSMRDLSGVIERLRREKAPTAMRHGHAANTVLQLESVPTSSHAVYQTVKREQADSIKTELNEVHHMLHHARTIVGPDGKAMTTHQYDHQGGGSDSGETAEQSISDETETNNLCETCNLTFQTQKTLELHVLKHHSSTAFVFQCPACSLTFLQAAAVIRHLSKDHKKPTRRIRMMRNTILKRRVQQGDIQPKGPSRELKRLQMSDDFVGNAPDRIDVTAEQRKIMSLCIYCEKSFERRAALSTHLLNCRAKQEALAKPVPPVKRMKFKTNGTAPSSMDIDSAGAAAEPAGMEISERSLEQAADAAAETDSNALNAMFADLAEQNDNYMAGLKTVSLEKMQLPESDTTASDEGSNTEDDEHEQATTDESKANECFADHPAKPKKKRSVPIEKQLRCRCKICHKQFNALGNLRRHISMFHYRARRFGCTMCDYRAFRRYDIVNHLGFTHKIEGDRKKLDEQYVSTHECKYSRDDVDGDIVLLSEESPPTALAKPPDSKLKTYEKRLKRTKTISEVATSVELPPNSNHVEVKEEPAESTSNKKRRKSRTQISPEHAAEPAAKLSSAEKRPIRKRVKAVNKDFVYDLVSFKADPTAPSPNSADSMRAKLRRQNGNAPDSKLWEAYLSDSNKPQVQGITRRLVLELVSQGRAVSATLPELPAERPQIRPRLISHTRGEGGQNVVQVHSTSAGGESFIEKIAKRTAAAGKDAATISNLWHKVNTAISQKEEVEQHAAAVAAAPEYQTPNDKLSVDRQLTPPSPPRKSLMHATTTISPAHNTTIECLSNSMDQLASVPPAPMFPALPKPPSVLEQAASGTIQLTLDSLLRAALQN